MYYNKVEILDSKTGDKIEAFQMVENGMVSGYLKDGQNYIPPKIREEKVIADELEMPE